MPLAGTLVIWYQVTMTDAELLARFEALTLPPTEFRHREHVRLAFAMLAEEADFAAAAQRYRTALRRFATNAGVPGKYHETITWAYLALVHQRMHEHPCAASLELLERCPELLDHRGGALARHYDVGAITASEVARRIFVLPER